MLNKNGYDILLKTKADSEKYCFEPHHDGSHNVYKHKNPDKKRYFRTSKERCYCNECVANQKHCRHEWYLNPKFDPDFLSLNYHNHGNITKSTYIGEYKNLTCRQISVSYKIFVLSDDIGTEKNTRRRTMLTWKKKIVPWDQTVPTLIITL